MTPASTGHVEETLKRSLIALLAVASLLLAALPAAVIAQPSGTATTKDHSKVVERAPDGVYIVRLAEDPAIAYTGGIPGYAATAPAKGGKLDSTSAKVKRYVAYLTKRHEKVLAGVGAASSNKIYSYVYTLNGFAAVLTHAQATKLAASAGIASVQPDRLRKKATDNSGTFLGLSAAGGLWTQGEKGEDVIVGIIDSGIWPEHPSFSDQRDLADRPGASGKRNLAYGAPPSTWNGTCQSGEQWSQDDCNNKLIGARYFLSGFGKHGIIHDDFKSARDSEGHGTHTASTAAGNAGVKASIFGIDRGTISGIAPRARIAVYKGLWNTGSGYTTDLAAAIDAAVGDGVDVINYSIGSDSPSFDSADAIAFMFANAGGVFSSVSAGNAGPGAETVGSPAAAPWVMTVGASTQSRSFTGSVRLGNGVSYAGSSVTRSLASTAIVDGSAAGSELCIGGELDPADVAGKIVLCLRGGNGRVAKSAAVKAAGGVGMVLYNQSDAMVLMSDNFFVPTVMVTNTTGLAVKAYIAGAGAAATATLTTGVATASQGSRMADFSSRGPNAAAPDLLKPDITAPGVQILAGNTPVAAPQGELFQSIAGTSMSAPHIAGIAALIVGAHPTWTPDQVKSAIMLTARQNVTKEDGTTAAGAFDFGAGHVVPNSAVDPGVTLQQGVNFRSTLFDYAAYTCQAIPYIWAPGTCDFIGYTIEASDLNLASISISQLVGSQTTSRTFTSVAATSVTWTPSVEGLPGIAVSLPSPVAIAAGGTATWDVTFTRGAAPVDQWVQGAIVWAGGGKSVRMPVVLKPVQLDFPTVVIAPVATTSGLVEWNVKAGYTGDLSADGFGLAADAVLTGQAVAQDPDQDIETDTFSSGVTSYDFTLGAAARYFAGGTREATTSPGSDLDVFLFKELADGAAGYSLDDLVAVSADGDSEEIVELVNPAGGNYRLVIHGWLTSGGSGSAFDLHRWTVDQATADTGTLVATVDSGDDIDPAQVTTGATVGIDAAVSGLVAPGQYRGTVTYRDAVGAIGTTVLLVDH